MASSLSSSCSLNLPNNYCCRLKELNKYPQVRSQSFSDDGASANIVDSNMGVLRERIAEVKVKERLDKCYCKNLNNNEWNYGSGYDHKHNRFNMLSECFEVLSSAISALGLVFLSGSLCLFLVSLLVHINH